MAGSPADGPSLFLTLGSGRKRPRGEARAVRDAVHLVQVLSNHKRADAWWSAHSFRDNHRKKENWLSSCAVAVDIDYYNTEGKHATPPDAARREIEPVARSSGATLFHHTPRGLRLVWVLTTQCGDLTAWMRAANNIGEQLVRRLASSSFRVDKGASYDCARFLWAPTTVVEGTPRAASVEMVGAAIGLEALASSDEEPERANPSVDPIAPVGASVIATDGREREVHACADAGSIAQPATAKPYDSMKEAVGAYRREHRLHDIPRNGGRCPLCRHSGCFGLLDGDEDRWFCFSENHECDSNGAGVAGEKGWHGDVLDLHAAANGLSRRELLQREGYLASVFTSMTSFPVEALPPICRRIVEEGAAAQGVDEIAWGVALCGALSAAVVNSRALRLKSTHREPGVAWFALVGVSGTGKSASADTLFAAHRERDLELGRTNSLALADFARKLTAFKAAQRRRVKDAGAILDLPEAPPILCATVGDCTVEALAARLASNRRGIALVVDELTGWLASFGAFKPSKAGGSLDASKWLELYAGRQIKIDRKTGDRTSFVVPNAAASVYGTVQPNVLHRALGRDGFESGLAARLFVAILPRKASRYTNDEVDPQLLASYHRMIRALLDLEPGGGGPVELELDDAARRLWIDFQNSSEQTQNQSPDDTFSAIAKTRGGAARIALLVALAAAAERGPDVARELRVVGADAMASGIRLAKWFMDQALAIYSSWRQREGQERATVLQDRIRGWIRRTGVAEFTERDVRQGLKHAGDRNVAGLSFALSAMVDAGELRRMPNGRLSVPPASGGWG